MATKTKGSRKHGRNKKKAAGKMNPISWFIRGKITAETYFNQTNQSLKKG